MKIICVGRNYAEHAREMMTDVPRDPLLFMKPSTAIIKGNSMVYPGFTKKLHYEVEVLLFINKTGRNIRVADAHDYYQHIGLGLDFTARDLQSKFKKRGQPWEKAKAFDGSAAVSEKYDKEKYNSEDIIFRLELNGEEVQRGNTGDMIFSFDYIVHHISTFFTLEEGDIIFTGTPEGVGPVSPGDTLQAFMGDELCLNLSIIRE